MSGKILRQVINNHTQGYDGNFCDCHVSASGDEYGDKKGKEGMEGI